MTMDGAGGQGHREMDRLAQVPVLSDRRHLRSVPNAHHRPTVAKFTARVKGHCLCMPLWTDTYMNIQVTHVKVHQVHKSSRGKITMNALSCILKHNYMFANSSTSTQDKRPTINKRPIPSHPSPLSPRTQRAVTRAERPSNTPTKKADMDQ